VAKAYEFSHLF